MRPMSRTRWTIAALVAAAALLGLTACGGDDDDGGVASASESDTATDAAGDDADDTVTEDEALAYAQCMRDNGVDIPDPTVDENGEVQWDLDEGRTPGAMDPEVMEQASEVCGQPPGIDQEAGLNDEDTVDAMLEYAQCMRDNGYEDFPDPQVGDNQAAPFPDIDRETPEFEQAHEACRHIMEEARTASGDEGSSDGGGEN